MHVIKNMMYCPPVSVTFMVYNVHCCAVVVETEYLRLYHMLQLNCIFTMMLMRSWQKCYGFVNLHNFCHSTTARIAIQLQHVNSALQFYSDATLEITAHDIYSANNCVQNKVVCICDTYVKNGDAYSMWRFHSVNSKIYTYSSTWSIYYRDI